VTANLGIYDGVQRPASPVLEDPRPIIADRRVGSTSTTVGTYAAEYSGLNTLAVLVGTMVLANNLPLSGTITRIGWGISASSSTGTQKAYLVHYDADASGGPSSLMWSEEIDGVTAQFATQRTREARRLTPGGFVGVYVPAGNAGTITFRSGSISTRSIVGFLSVGANAHGKVLQLGSDGVGGRMPALSDTTPPSSVSHYEIKDNVNGAIGFGVSTNTASPLVWFRSAA
jgi:hypothetical protein